MKFRDWLQDRLGLTDEETERRYVKGTEHIQYESRMRSLGGSKSLIVGLTSNIYILY